MAATETPLAARDDGAAKRRLQVMEEVAARLAKLAESNRKDLAVRALEALRQKLTLLKMQALAAILRGDRPVALALADELEELARAIIAAERDCATAGGGGADIADAVPILGPQTPAKKGLPPIAGEAELEMATVAPPVTLEDSLTEAAELAHAAASVRGAPDRYDLRELSAVLSKRSSPLLPLFDTSDGPDAVATDAANLIRSLRRAAYRARRRPGEIDARARMDASAIAASLGSVGLFGMVEASIA
ncbi:hypothetical protein K7957_00710 [Sphingomonas yunnanensis]|uniref:hypothetical protein n=1 Tax=Sphingomonas yunnanensis TaxID=310400 RepID=UPI001CA68DCC|nr:hypothetical protein [Sphingomonas yunnanensis]MBY9061452.1 hypothetical protein [Sphingomonas yunnanensis]